MTHDYSAYQRERLDKYLLNLDAIGDGLTKDYQTKKKAEKQLNISVSELNGLDPHIAYLWFRAKKEVAEKQGNKINKDKYQAITTIVQDEWKKTFPKQAKDKNPIDEFGLNPDIRKIEELPLFSFIFSIPFKLNKPFISKDEEIFYLIDNPVYKEKLFGNPMIASTSWKGALRYTFHQSGYPDSDKITIRLFGNPRENEALQSGRLSFYSSFFDKTAFEIINPHNRVTGITKHGPILIEAVPAYQCSLFSLLYVPMFAPDQTPEKIIAEMVTDMELVAQGIQAMLTVYGFGAKTSSGYGVVKDELTGKGGKLAVRLPAPSAIDNEGVSPQRLLPQTNWSFQTLTELPELAKLVGETVTTSQGAGE
jgi:CRISPR-associated protein Cmr2